MNLNEYRKTFLKPVNNNLKFRETLDTLEQDNEFQKKSERFLTSVGENSDDIFEYLRDSDYNLYNGFKRASESKLFTPEQKADYRYLRKRFDRADTGSLKQYLGAAKDIGIDLVTDPTLLTAVISSPITGGATLLTRASLAKGASTGLKQLAKNQTNKAIAVTAAEAGGWTGLDNYFRQETEVNTGIRKLFSTPELVGSTALGTLMGGLLGAGAQKLAIVHSKKASEFTDDEYLEQVGSMAAYRLGTRKDKIIARTIGKPTAILNTMAQFSPIADALRKLIRYDAGKEFFNRTNKPLEFSFGENINWRTGNYKLMYEQAISPLYTKQNGVMTDTQQQSVISLLRGGPKKGATMAEIVVANNLKKFYDTIFNHAVKNKLISPQRRVENYFPISWNRKVIKENPEKFKELLLKENAVSPDNVDEVIAKLMDSTNIFYGETANILTSKRTLNIKDENVFKEFLINDLHAVSHAYYAKAARNIESKKAFGLDKITSNTNALNEFEKKWINPLNQELIAKGVKGGLTKTERNNIVNLFKTLTGDLTYYQSDLGQGIYDTLKLSQQVAHLPLATLSSMSEVFIPLTKGKPNRYTQELLKSMGEAGELFTKKIPRILKDKHNLSQPEVFNEMNKVFLAVEEALADRVENLAGEGMQTEWVKKGARGFFKANLLTQWTKMVQLASFNIGKDLIRSNLKELHKASKAGTDIFKATGKLRRYKEELFDLGIDIEQGIKWVDDGAKQADARKAYSELTDSEKFYQVNLIRGAGRFVNEVILNPAREQAIKPIIQSNPRVDILFQFLGYPTAFSNTVLKNYARQLVLNPAANAPKILSATLLMTGTALGLNYVRGSDESREKYFKDPQKTIQKAIQRVGLLGPLEHGVRFSNSLEYSKNPALSLLTLGGPILDDTLGSVFYRRGLSETLAKNLPGYASKNVLENLTGLTPYDNITEGARKFDKSLKESMFGKTSPRKKYERSYNKSYRQNYAEGGKVLNELPSLSFLEDDTLDLFSVNIDTNNPVLNVKDDPSKRTNPYTGQAYKKGILGSLERRQAATGGEIRQQYMAGALVSKVGAKLFSPTLKAIRTYATKDLKGQGAIDFVTSPKAVQKGIKPREIERLEVVDYLKNNPDVSLIDALPEISKKEIQVSGETQLTPTGMTKHVAFNNPKDASVSSLNLSKVLRSELMKGDKDIVPLEESIAMIRESGHRAFPMKDITQEEIFKMFPSENNKKINFIDDPFGESFIYGNETDGYSAFYKGNFFTMNFPKDLNEAKIRFKQIINESRGLDIPVEIVSKEKYKQVGSKPVETYGKAKAFKTFIDYNLPGGKNYAEVSINWDNAIQKHRVGHFNPDSENQLMHILGRDRKLKDGTLSKHADEVQNDLDTRAKKVGYKPPPKEVEKEKDKVSKLLDGISSKNYTGKPNQVKYELIMQPREYKVRSTPELQIRVLTDRYKPSESVPKPARSPEDFPLITPPEEEDIGGFIFELRDIVNLDSKIKGNTKGINRLQGEEIYKPSLVKVKDSKEYRQSVLNALEDRDLLSKEKRLDIELALEEKGYINRKRIKGRIPYDEFYKTLLDTFKLKDFQAPTQKSYYIDNILNDPLWSTHYGSETKDRLVEALGKDIHKLGDSVKILLQDQKGVPDYPLQKDWELLGVKQWLLKAVREDKDAISFSSSEVMVNRYSESSKDKYIKIYDVQIPKHLKKLAKKYGGKFEKSNLDQQDVFGSRMFPGWEEYNASSKVNVLTITPEMKEKILAEGLPTYGYRKGGLVNKLKQRNMYG